MMNNEAVIKMVKAGLSEDLVVFSIKSQPGAFATTPDDLIALKSAGASNKIIAAIIEKGASGSAAGAPSTTPPAEKVAAATATGASPVNEVGVYFKKGGTWTDLPPEVVNFKTGGVMKSIGTAGIVKGDINGHVNGNHGKTQLKSPVELLVYTPEGTAITEYQLLRLREQKDSREFRTVTGGLMHVSGGATRDLIPFESKKIAPRTYEIVLPGLGGGDFGLLPPAGGDSTSSSGRIGKVYSFRLIEQRGQAPLSPPPGGRTHGGSRAMGFHTTCAMNPSAATTSMAIADDAHSCRHEHAAMAATARTSQSPC